MPSFLLAFLPKSYYIILTTCKMKVDVLYVMCFCASMIPENQLTLQPSSHLRLLTWEWTDHKENTSTKQTAKRTRLLHYCLGTDHKENASTVAWLSIVACLSVAIATVVNTCQIAYSMHVTIHSKSAMIINDVGSNPMIQLIQSNLINPIYPIQAPAVKC
jgi:hypothetical protein